MCVLRRYLAKNQLNIKKLQRNSGDELWIAFRIQFAIPALLLRNAFTAYLLLGVGCKAVIVRGLVTHLLRFIGKVFVTIA